MSGDQSINFNNKTFYLVSNSDKGQVNSDTVFKYQQEGDLVTADYYGGTVKYGKIIAKLIDGKLEMLYQCLTEDGDLKAGCAIAEISKNEAGKLILSLQWKWLGDQEGQGTSQYIEA